eukprot:TRINITY_DN33273_c0_g1_i1.p1 TRINITY_DN33273_c0_g1~~TRINITY_DN33273_c0_g1_i1.p1  ORF type:complete len:1400 (+),score=291.76 TRINITY_DN33273_c0_g1_i1:112-4200(+)
MEEHWSKRRVESPESDDNDKSLAFLLADADRPFDEELQRANARATPSTAASTPVPAYAEAYSKRPNSSCGVVHEPLGEDQVSIANQSRPLSGPRASLSRGPVGIANVRWRQTSGPAETLSGCSPRAEHDRPNRPASSQACHSARHQGCEERIMPPVRRKTDPRQNSKRAGFGGRKTDPRCNSPSDLAGHQALPARTTSVPAGGSSRGSPTPPPTCTTPTQRGTSRSNRTATPSTPRSSTPVQSNRSPAHPSQRPDSSLSTMSISSKAELPSEPALQGTARLMTKALIAYYQKKASKGEGGGGPSWTRFLAELNSDGSGMVSFDELDEAVRHQMRAPVSRYELRVFWRRLDEDNCGQASTEEFARLMYKIELAQWPDLTEKEMTETVRILSAAAEKWHRAGGNWFKIFSHVDADGNGQLSYDELVQTVRGTLPCLRLSPKELPERLVQGLWKALDYQGQILVPVHRFMVCMRKWGGDLGIHKLTEYSKAKRGIVEQKRGLPQLQERTPAEVRAIATAVEKALSSYYIDRGYLSVASASEAAAAKGGPSGNESCGWKRFFEEMLKECSVKLAYDQFVKAVLTKLSPWLNPSVALPVGGYGREVSKEDLRALWEKLDPSSMGEVTAKDMMLGLYRIQLEGWPDADAESLTKLASLIDSAAVKRLRCGGNWYKVFKLVDKAGSGRLSFDSLKEVVRDIWYGLSIAPEAISDRDLKALWKALDVNKSGDVSVAEFMVFMRRFGAKHNMHKLTRYSMAKRGMVETEHDYRQEIEQVPALEADVLCSLSTRLMTGVHQWLSRPGAPISSLGDSSFWGRLIEQTETKRRGRVKYDEFRDLMLKVAPGKPTLTDHELMAFFREADRGKSGECAGADFDNAVYRLQVDCWPELDEQGILRVIGALNAAADKWHRASGNWFKVFQACDEDGSGAMTFDEMVGVIRKSFPGLGIPTSKITDEECRAFWKALDVHRCGHVEVYDFIVFMRKHGAAYSMHKSINLKKLDASQQEMPPPCERSDDELRQFASTLDEALSAYWNRRGVYVRAVDKWQRFLEAADVDRDGHLTFQELERSLCIHLKNEKTVFDGLTPAIVNKKTLEQYHLDGAVVNGMSHDDLYALWCKFDQNRSGYVTFKEWTLGVYRLWLETWPGISPKKLAEVVDKISSAAAKVMGKGSGWYKVFKLVDVDGSGSIGYDEFFKIIRRPLPCLAIPTSHIPAADLQALWRAMDEDRSGSIALQEFMLFMRRLEAKRGYGNFGRPSAARGNITNKASRLMESAARAKASAELSEAQLEQLKAPLKRLSAQALRDAYDKWEVPWNDHISEWEWHRLVRELLHISEEEVDDDAVHAVFLQLDKDRIGEIPVESTLALTWA